MKALTLRQPWATIVLELGKNIENRRWSTSFRGDFLIHAGKAMTRAEYDDAVDFAEEAMGVAGYALVDEALGHGYERYRKSARFGGIVGRARLVKVIGPCALAERGKEPAISLFPDTCKHLWHMPEQYGFVLEDIRPLPFVPLRGELGFFPVPSSVLTALRLTHEGDPLDVEASP